MTEPSSRHDPGGYLGGTPYFHPIHRPDPSFWRPMDKDARRLHRMGLATEDVSALVAIANRLSDPSEIAAAMKALIVAVNALHALMAKFHHWFQSAGRLGLTETIAVKESALFKTHASDAPFPGPIKRVRDKIGAHIDAEADEVDLLALYADLDRFKTALQPMLRSTYEYVNFVISLPLGDWAREKDGSLHVCQMDLPPQKPSAVWS